MFISASSLPSQLQMAAVSYSAGPGLRDVSVSHRATGKCCPSDVKAHTLLPYHTASFSATTDQDQDQTPNNTGTLRSESMQESSWDRVLRSVQGEDCSYFLYAQ
jgi:hypothetical protein